jgi:hypothetical protein
MQPERPITERLEILERADWQMALGERAMMEGILSQLKPELAIEVGTAAGGSLARIAAHSTEVHAIDLSGEQLTDCPPNATFHLGDSRRLLPELLQGFASSRRNVDFVLLDGDHSTAGAAADLNAVLDSEAVARSLVLMHDSFNPLVRSGIESVGLDRRPEVVAYDVDAVPGRVGKVGGFRDQLLGGFAIMLVDRTAPGAGLNLGYWSLQPDPVLVDDTHSAAARLADLIVGKARSTGGADVPLDAASLQRHRIEGERASKHGPGGPIGRLKAHVRRLLSRRSDAHD